MGEKEATKKTLRELSKGQAPKNDLIVAAQVGGEIRGLDESVGKEERPVWV